LVEKIFSHEDVIRVAKQNDRRLANAGEIKVFDIAAEEKRYKQIFKDLEKGLTGDIDKLLSDGEFFI